MEIPVNMRAASTKKKLASTLAAAFLGFVFATTMLNAQIKIGSVLPYASETPHPYPTGNNRKPVVWQETVSSPGAQSIRIHFVGFSLGPGDFLTITAVDGSESQTYTGRGPFDDGEFWSFTVEQDDAVIALHSGNSPEYGYQIDAIAHGDISMKDAYSAPAEANCTSGFENVVCHDKNAAFWAGQKPVAKLIFVDDDAEYVGTGWLVSGYKPNLLITNNHNIPTKEVAKTLQVVFDFQTGTCDGGGGNGTEDRFQANPSVFETNDDRDNYDYTIVGLLKNDAEESPSRKWGDLTASSKDPGDKDKIWIPQHPHGQVKQAGWFSDNDHKTDCSITGFDGTTRVEYICGIATGSSGAPVEDPNNAPNGIPLVVALHHRNVQSANSCPALGIKMSAICADDRKKQHLLACSK